MKTKTCISCLNIEIAVLIEFQGIDGPLPEGEGRGGVSTTNEIRRFPHWETADYSFGRDNRARTDDLCNVTAAL